MSKTTFLLLFLWPGICAVAYATLFLAEPFSTAMLQVTLFTYVVFGPLAFIAVTCDTKGGAA